MLQLFCYVRGDDPRCTFEVNIDEEGTVSDLKDAIKEEFRPEFDDIPASSLSLWKASVHCNLDLKKRVEALNLVDDDSLLPGEILSDIFSSGLESRSVHIIIKLPYLGELQLPMSLFNNTLRTLVTSARRSRLPSATRSESTLLQCNKILLLANLFFGCDSRLESGMDRAILVISPPTLVHPSHQECVENHFSR